MKLDLDVKNIFMKSKSWRMKQDELISYNFTENILPIERGINECVWSMGSKPKPYQGGEGGGAGQ